MSLWDVVKKVNDYAVNQVNQTQQNVMKYKERYERLDDEALKRKYRMTSGYEKCACAMLLKERGYGNSNTD